MATQHVSEVALTAQRVESLNHVLDEVNMMFRAIHDLATGIASAGSDAQVIAISSMSKLGAFKADQVKRALGSRGFGNFAEEFEDVPEERTDGNHE